MNSVPKILFSHYSTKGLMWFRFFGVGLCIKNIHLHPLLFSERRGKVRIIKIGKWAVKVLNKSGI